MRILRILLPLIALFMWSATTNAQDEGGGLYTLATRCIPAEGGHPSPESASYAAGASVTVNCSTTTGFRFLQWEDEEGNVVSTTSRFNYTMPAQDVTLIARFEYAPSLPEEPTVPDIKTYATVYMEVSPSNGGSIRKYGDYIEVDGFEAKYVIGSTARLVANANSGFRFVNWTENGEIISTSATLSFTVEEESRNLVANFEYEPSTPSEPGTPVLYHKLTLTSNPETAVSSLSGGGEYADGRNINVRGNANEYYVFENWTDDLGNIVSDVLNFSYIMPSRHVTLTANFRYEYSYDPSTPDEPGSPGNDESGVTARPRISMYDDTHVMMLSSTSGATIYYTLDGSEPTTGSHVYSNPVFVPSNLLVKAIAVKDGLANSDVTTYQVTSYHAAAPVFTFKNYKVEISSATQGAVIRYTIGRNDPTEDSPIYQEPIELNDGDVIRAIAYAENLTPSDVSTFVFEKSKYTVEAPAVTLNENGRIEIVPAVEGSVIRYTTDGSIPDLSSTVYGIPFTPDGNCTVKAYTTHTNYFDSPIGEYVVDIFKVERPELKFSNRVLSMSVPTYGASIRYTIDGSVPTESSTLYNQPMNLTEDCRVIARGFKNNYEPSDTVSYIFVYANHQVAQPEVTYDPATRTMTMTCDTEDASIRYTTNGATPTATTGVSYSDSFVVEGNKTFIVRAFRNDLLDSEVTTLTVDDQQVPTPTASFSNKRLRLTCSDTEATIRFTLDGIEPTSESTRYTGPIELTEDCTVRFIGVRDGFNNSEEGTYEFAIADHQVAQPVVKYDPSTRTVTMSSATEDASIRYTTNGNIPTATTGISYSAPFASEGNHTYTVRAFRNDLFDSEVTTLTVNDQQVPTPTATFSNKRLRLTCSDTEATIRYTLDGSQPTVESTRYTGPFELTSDCTVRFIAFRDGFNNSEEGTYEFAIADHQVAQPEVTYDPATLTVTMTCATEEASIRYTTNGNIPTATTGISYSAPFVSEGNYTYTVRAFRNDLFDSEVTILTVNDQQVPTPTATFSNKRLRLTCSDTEATIRYTLDGSQPTVESTRYTGPFELTSDCTVRFIAFREGFNNSEEGTYEFAIADHQVSQPVVTYDPSTRTVTMSSATEDASIRYTTNGNIPTATTGISYSAPFASEGNHTYTVRAFRNDLFDSEVTILTVNDQQVPTPTASFTNRQLTLTCSDGDAEIHYTVDGSVPTASSTLYTGPVALTSDCTVKFIAVRTGYNDSDVASFEFRKSNYQVAKPVMDYDTDSKALTMTCSTGGAVIRYTTDGSVPTATTGTVYSGPVTVDGNHTYTAVAFADGLFDSDPAMITIDSQKVPTPTATFANRQLTLSCPDAKAEIHYTLDGSTPTASSALYSGPVSLTEDCTVRFIAVREGYNNSEVASFDFVRSNYTVATPTISYDYAKSQVTMGCATQGASIRYTTDGSVPTAVTGILYEGPIAVSGNQTFTAVAFADGLFDSEVTVLSIDDQKVPTPTASFANRQLTLTCPDANAEIHYTVDGSVPTASSTLYTGPVALTSDCTVKFIAVRTGFNDSDVASFEFRKGSYQVSTPVMDYDTDSKTLTMTCSTDGAVIRYTTDGSVPTATTGTVYSGPVTVDGNHTYTAVAFADGLFDSDPAMITIDSQKVPTPTATFANRQLTLSCPDAKAEIHYTLDGSTPTASSALYSGPVSLTEDCTVRFIAVREGYNNSEVASFDFVRSNYTVATPTISYDSAKSQVTMGCATQGASIRYTTDGSVPTTTTGSVYTGPITVDGNHTYTAVAFAEGLFDSETATLTIDSQKVPTPTATFANKVLTLSCPDSTAKIHYTVDGSMPTVSSTLYTGPISLTSDCTVLFIAVSSGYSDSDVASFEFKKSSYQVSTPVIDYNSDTKILTMTCATVGAVIRYTTDGTVPTATTGTIYSSPITVDRNLTYTAVALANGLFDSEIATMAINDQKVSTPTAAFANKLLTLTCSDVDAEIHYTTDGSAPSSSSNLYSAPVALTEDCMVLFIAVREGYNDSDVASFDFRISRYQTSKPVMDYDTDSKTLRITCNTEGAVIRYTTDGTVPSATSGMLYSAPIPVNGNMTFTAVAFADGLFDSEAVVLSIDDQKVPTPTATFSNKHLTLNCADSKAEIHYTIDGSVPTLESMLYTEPLSLNADCTVRFIAIREGYKDSEISSFELNISDYTEAVPMLVPDYRGRTVEITQTSLLPVLVSINGNSEIMTTPATIKIEQGMDTIKAVAIASDEDRYDSDASQLDIVFHSSPVLDYDGHSLRYALSADEADPINAEAYIYIDGDLHQQGESEGDVDILGFSTVRAVIESDYAFRSEESVLQIDYFNTGSRAGARNGHRLSEGFGMWGDDVAGYKVLEVTGEVEKKDLEFLGSLPWLETLYLDPIYMTTEPCDSVFSGSRIETVSSSSYPEGMLKGMQRITTVIWNHSDERMPEGRLAEAGNPNILFWTQNSSLAPADAVNIVVFSNGATEGVAESITLQCGYPFHAHRSFIASKAELTKEFSLPTVMNECAGWETLVVPFAPESIMHETSGSIVPFKVWNGPEDNVKPFWLYYASADGWVESDAVEAGVPYIISMPNNEAYIDGYNLVGKVTFSTATETEFGVDSSSAAASEWIGGTEFVGTFMPVEEKGIRSINVNELDGLDYLGSAFIEDDVTLPFGAYIRGSGLPQRMPIFGDWTGVPEIASATTGILVETPAPGAIRVNCNRACRVAVVTPDGAVIRTLSLRAGESVTVDGLTRGLYIVGGSKVMVK